MPVITIPKKLTKPFLTDDVAVIPRKEYDALVRAKNGARELITVKRTMKVPKKYEKFYDELDQELTESLREVDAGHYYGPFDTAEDGIAFLKSREKVGHAK